jgi:hypothetical protein
MSELAIASLRPSIVFDGTKSVSGGTSETLTL